MRLLLPLPEVAPTPASVADLGSAERLVVLAVRRWVLGWRTNSAVHWSWVWNEFARELGAGPGREALAAFAAMMKAVQGCGCRPLRVCHPCCPCVGADETRLMTFVAACQQGAARQARDLAEGMVRAEAAGELLAAGAGLGRLMTRQRLRLPRRAVTPSGGEDQAMPVPRPVVVH